MRTVIRIVTVHGLLWALLLNTAVAGMVGGVDTIINHIDPQINMGVEVVDLTTGKTLYTRNAHRAFIPASNMKLFSEAAALMVLGPDYRFKNQLSTDAKVLKGNVLTGNLYLHLSGDPSFSYPRLSRLLTALKTWDIQTIHGDVVIESALNSVSPYPPGWTSKDLGCGYAAPIAPLMIDANRVVVTINPGAKLGSPALIEIGGIPAVIPVENKVLTKRFERGCGVGLAMDENTNALTVTGCIGRSQWAIQQQIAIRNPGQYAQKLIVALLHQQGITLDGQVIFGRSPKGTLVLAKDESKPLAQLMADTLKPSDNLYADSLFLHAAKIIQGEPVNWDKAKELVKTFLHTQTGITMDGAVLTDGSGLSRQDLITPSQTTQLLQFLFDRFPLSYEYIAALPVSGRDGTLQKRFKRPSQQDLVRAKTGTMTGVLSLSGYLYTRNGHTLGFSIFINTRPGTSSTIAGRYRYLIDSLCAYFLRQKPAQVPEAHLSTVLTRVQYQRNPTEIDRDHAEQNRWRRLETAVKRALVAQPVTVIFRNAELILQDNQASADKILAVLTRLQRQYPFAFALLSKEPPRSHSTYLWKEDLSVLGRTWVIRAF